MRCQAFHQIVTVLGLMACLAVDASPVLAQAPGTSSTSDVDPSKRVELITMDPGEHFFGLYGHAALCVFSDHFRGGRCYDYGTPIYPEHTRLFWDFINGHPVFQIKMTRLRHLTRKYILQDRRIHRQVLSLTPQQAHKLHESLKHDALPGNNRFVYHHFNDNCSTRLRNRLDDATEGEFSQGRRGTDAGTLRLYVRQGFGLKLHLLVASELLMGRVIDQPIDIWAAMFTPRNLREQVEAHFDAKPALMYERKSPPRRNYSPSLLWIFLGMTLAPGVPLAAAAWFGGPWVRWGALLVAISLLTLLASPGWTLAILSKEPELHVNEMLLVLVPLDFLMLRASWRRYYLPARLGLLALVAVLALSGVFIQPLLGPIAVTMALLSPAIIQTWRQSPSDASGEAT